MRAAKNDSAPKGRSKFGPGRAQLLQKFGRNDVQGQKNLWLCFSPRLQKDVILLGDARFEHFHWLEADPTVLDCDYSPAPLKVAVESDVIEFQFDALVRHRDKHLTYHRVLSDDTDPTSFEHQKEQRAAESAGFRYQLIDRDFLRSHQQLILNWRRGLPFIAACRDLVLEPFCNELIFAAARETVASLDALLNGTDPEKESIYLAAFFRCCQEGRLKSDMDVAPVCYATRVSTAEARP